MKYKPNNIVTTQGLLILHGIPTNQDKVDRENVNKKCALNCLFATKNSCTRTRTSRPIYQHLITLSRIRIKSDYKNNKYLLIMISFIDEVGPRQR